MKYYLTEAEYENAITGINPNWNHAVEINKNSLLKMTVKKNIFMMFLKIAGIQEHFQNLIIIK